MKRALLIGSIGIVGLLVTAASMWWLIPKPQVTARPLSKADAFVLPTPPPVLPGSLAATVSGSFFGAAAARADEAVATPPWRFVGAVAAQADPFVLVSFDSKDPEVRRIGDTLPGGARIVRIRHDRICIRLGDSERTLKIYSE
jgi:hypothetical protein